MKHLIEFPLEGGDSILIEVDTDEKKIGNLDPVLRGEPREKVIERAGMTFQAAMDKVKPLAQTIITKLRGLHDSPDEIEVVFGLKLNAEAGMVVAATGVEANYTVKLKWVKKESNPTEERIQKIQTRRMK